MVNFILIGTSHIAQQSIEEIKTAIENHKPNIIAVELDAARFHSLLQNKRSKITLSTIKQIGIKGYLFVLIGSYIQKKLAKIVGTTPGSDMLTAIKHAKAKSIPLALIDQPIYITIRRFSQTLSWKERWNFLADIFRGIFFWKSQMKRYGLDTIDLQKVPEEKLIQKLISHLKTRYPNIYKTLIDERNHFMEARLKEIAAQNTVATILVVIGAGHKEFLQKACKKMQETPIILPYSDHK